MSRRYVRMDQLVESDQTDGVLLPAQKIGERGGKKLRVLEFGYLALVRVAHRRACINQQVTLGISVGPVLLDEVAVSTTQQTPIQVAQVIAGIVLTIFRELG